ncbi:MAG: cytochrome c oxidase subunit 3 family protein [Proteobacteria bacterium]|nr:cytochrome c oxidase subunit 3 family protein [Pseudomonadota bacterium]
MKPADDNRGKTLGMWLFLYSEIILFGGLFVLYAVFFSRFSQDFVQGGHELSRIIGSINTLILLTSSFTVAASITAIRRNQVKTAICLIGFSMACGLVFLINKYMEWGHKIHMGIYPNSERLMESSPGFNIFFGMYYIITGLHGLHVLIGTILLGVSLVMLIKGKITQDSHALLENSGLYWHLVDLIWIFVFPLFYLVL